MLAWRREIELCSVYVHGGVNIMPTRACDGVVYLYCILLLLLLLILILP
jgi:hypothetical protein